MNTLKQILADNLSADKDSITESSSLQDDLGADSLDAVELIMAIEDEFSLEIDSKEAEGIKTVGDLISLIQAKQA
jgi:acyl carrier protein